MDEYQNPGGQTGGEEPQRPPWQREPKEDIEQANEPVFESETFMPSKKRPIGTYAIAAAILIVAIFIANAAKDSSTENLSEQNNTGAETSEEVVKESVFNLDGFFDGIRLGDFEDLDQASLIVNSAQGKPTTGDGSEKLTFSVVESEQDNMVYFATESLNPATNEAFVGIYHYNTLSNRWQRIYKTMFTEDGPTPPFVLHVLGRIDNQLILLKNKHNSSPGPCTSPWLIPFNGVSELLLLSLDDPYSNFESFTLPDVLREREEKAAERCRADL